MIKSFLNQKEDKKEKKDEDLKNLIDQLIEQQKLTMKVLEAITKRVSYGIRSL